MLSRTNLQADGHVSHMDTRLVHSAMNCSNEPRIHLVIVNLDRTGPTSGTWKSTPFSRFRFRSDATRRP